MADNKTIYGNIQLRGLSTQGWLEHADFIPADREPCLNTDTGVLRFGDGTTPYKNLKDAIIPGDGKSIEVSIENGISIKGMDTATEGQQLRIVNKGTAEAPKYEVEWFTPDTSDVEDLQERVGTLEGTVETQGTAISDLEKAAENLATAISDETKRAEDAEKALDDKIAAIDFIDETELADAIKDFTTKKYVDDEIDAVEKTVSDLATDVETNYAKTTYVDGEIEAVEKTIADVAAELGKIDLAEGEKVLTFTDKKLASHLSIKKEKKADGKTYVQLLGVNGELVSEFDADEFVADGMLEKVEKDEATNEIVFTWNTTAGKSETRIDIDDLVEVYTGGNGINVDGFEISIDVDDTTESFLSVGTNGIKLAGVQDAIDTAEQAAKDYADAQIAAFDHAQFATKEELNTAKSDLEKYADKAEEDAISSANANTAAKLGDIKDSDNNEITVKAYVDAKETAINGTIENLRAGLGALAGKDKVGATDLTDALAETINNKADKTTVDTLSENLTKGIKEAKDYTDTEIGKLDTKAQGYADTAKSGAISEAKSYTDAEIDKIEEVISGITTKDAQQDKAIEDNGKAIAVNAEAIEKNAEDIAANAEALKNVYTKTETDSAIAKAVTEAGHITKTIVEALPEVADAKENVIYMIKDSTGEDSYKEYMLINGALELIGSTRVDLAPYVKHTDLQNNGWQNYVPVATLENLGVVKSSEAVNGVKVAADGTMEVNNINISKLVQDEGQLFVLDGNVW